MQQASQSHPWGGGGLPLLLIVPRSSREQKQQPAKRKTEFQFLEKQGKARKHFATPWSIRWWSWGSGKNCTDHTLTHSRFLCSAVGSKGRCAAGLPRGVRGSSPWPPGYLPSAPHSLHAREPCLKTSLVPPPTAAHSACPFRATHCPPSSSDRGRRGSPKSSCGRWEVNSLGRTCRIRNLGDMDNSIIMIIILKSKTGRAMHPIQDRLSGAQLRSAGPRGVTWIAPPRDFPHHGTPKPSWTSICKEGAGCKKRSRQRT